LSFSEAVKRGAFDAVNFAWLSWSRLSEQNLCVDKWSLCRVRLPSGSAAG
jgi:hypothetical protein